MGFSSGSTMNSYITHVDLAPLLAMVVLMLGTCRVANSGRHGSALMVANNLKHHGALTVLRPPGCCSPCGPNDPLKGVMCPSVCAQCGDVVVAEGDVGTLDTHVGPYPLPFLQIQVKENVYCVEESALTLIKESVTLAVGPGGCGPFNGGLTAFVFALHLESPSRVAPPCLYLCNRD